MSRIQMLAPQRLSESLALQKPMGAWPVTSVRPGFCPSAFADMTFN